MNKVKSMMLGALVALIAFIGFGVATNAFVSAIDAVRDYSVGAIINGGATSVSELKADYAANPKGDLDDIYSAYGISSTMVNNSSAKVGYVTKTGNVVYNGKIVATGASTIGRAGYGADSKVVYIGGTKLYTHTTQRSFEVSTIPAFIWFDANGQYVGAVLQSCGNPIKATAVVVPPKPVYTCNTLTSTKITRDEYKFTTAATATNGATLYNYAYNYGDGTTANGGASINHKFAKAGTYKVSVTVQVKVDGNVVNAPSANCVVTVTVAAEPCPVPGKENLPKDSPDCYVDKPSVEIVKTVNNVEHDRVIVGNEFTYQVTVKNTGNVALKDAVVSDDAPEGVTFVSADQGTVADNKWTFTIGELKVGESKSFAIKAKMPAYKSGVIKNTACVETPTVPGGNPDDCDDATVETSQKIRVCDTTNDTIVEIDEKDFDEAKHTKDLSQCEEEPTPVVELPKTGVADLFGGSLGLGSLAGAVYYYGASRRALR